MRKSDGNIIYEPKKFQSFTNNNLKLEDVSCGATHNAVIATSSIDNLYGDVYTWGYYKSGQLGFTVPKTCIFLMMIYEVIENDEEYYPIPTKVELPEKTKVSRVVCGCDFTACLTEKGKIYTWGNNLFGNLGVNFIPSNNNSTIVWKPTLVTALANYACIQVLSNFNVDCLRE